MGEILNFDPNRGLQFDPGRRLGFDPGRNLEFDSGRTLEFQPNRDLGFGRRGVVFRGYVCPICGALVAEEAKGCEECGTAFEARARAAAPTVPKAPPPEPKPPARPRPETPARAPSPPPKATVSRRPGTFCAFCGAKLSVSDAFCWNCGSRTEGSVETVTLPPQKSERVTREWK